MLYVFIYLWTAIHILFLLILKFSSNKILHLILKIIQPFRQDKF